MNKFISREEFDEEIEKVSKMLQEQLNRDYERFVALWFIKENPSGYKIEKETYYNRYEMLSFNSKHIGSTRYIFSFLNAEKTITKVVLNLGKPENKPKVTENEKDFRINGLEKQGKEVVIIINKQDFSIIIIDTDSLQKEKETK